MNPRMSLVVRALAPALIAAGASAGPDWTEIPDAGKLNPQIIALPVQPKSIFGMLTGLDADGGLDVADTYDLFIENSEEVIIKTGGGSLLVTLEPGEGERGQTDFNTALWLFRLDDTGLLANRDAGPGQVFSRILPIATDGTGARIPGPGRYILAVSYDDVAPITGAGLPIFNFSNAPGATQVSGPDGAGGSQPYASWANETTMRPPGTYRIVITPQDCPPGCFGDANGDTHVDFLDITTVLSVWGSSCAF